jgi:hypothetical protein
MVLRLTEQAVAASVIVKVGRIVAASDRVAAAESCSVDVRSASECCTSREVWRSSGRWVVDRLIR